MNLSGLFVPLVTPFTGDDAVDLVSLERLARHVLDEGARGIVALGTTGEPANLTAAERDSVVDVCATICAERDAPLIVGAGSNSTTMSMASVHSVDPRAAAVLVVVPYYTRPTEAGVVEHFRRVAATSPVPVIVYDVPQRTGVTLGAETLRILADVPNIEGFKHAPGVVGDTTVRFLTEASSATAILAGDDVHIPALLALGAVGAIAASANVAPAGFAHLVRAWESGEVAVAQSLWRSLMPLAVALFAEPNPTVIKAVLAEQGVIASPAVRLPLLPASAAAIADALSVSREP